MSLDEWSSTPSPAPGRGRLSRALGVSLAAHAGFLVLLLVGVHQTLVDTRAEPPRLDAVYLPLPGPSGGGGGNADPPAARKLEVPPHELPQPAPVDPAPVQPRPPDPVPMLDVSIETNADTLLRAPGLGQLSLNPGGLGHGPGAGSGDLGGLGSGRGGLEGDGTRRSGGITMPALIRSVDPLYTPAALVAKLSGSVELEVVVLTDGSVGSIRVIKSLDTTHGLDQEAISAARQWRFQPGTVDGKPVEVRVKLILDFHIR